MSKPTVFGEPSPAIEEAGLLPSGDGDAEMDIPSTFIGRVNLWIISGEWKRTLKLFACCFGIVFLLGVYGFLQERIMTIGYDADSTPECWDDAKACLFKWTLIIVFCNRSMTVVFSMFKKDIYHFCSKMFMTGINRESFAPKCPIWKYALISISNVLATTCQYEALKYISFPMQMLGKSVKMVPVMIWGMIVSKKKYNATDWSAKGCVALGVTIGCTGFALFGDVSSRAAKKGSDVAWLYMFGMLLMCGYLMSDAFTSTFQEYLFKQEKTTKYNQMLYINLLSACMSLAMLTMQGGWDGFGFLAIHPGALVDMIGISAAATSGQWVIYTTIQDFGALVLAACMNVRQICSTLVSIVHYGQFVTGMQILSLVVVFTSLGLKTILKASGPRKGYCRFGGKKERPAPTKVEMRSFEEEQQEKGMAA